MTNIQTIEADLVVIGKIGATFGVKGWLHVHSFTSPADNIRTYKEWSLKRPGEDSWCAAPAYTCQRHKKGFIAKFTGVDDPPQAQSLVGSLIAVAGAQLPDIATPGEYYWRDLVGCNVRNMQGTALGVVQRILETGANDVLSIRMPALNTDAEQDILVPFVEPYVVQVDLVEKLIVVDWQADW